MGFNVDLKIVSLSKNHPFVNRPDEVTFSNEKRYHQFTKFYSKTYL